MARKTKTCRWRTLHKEKLDTIAPLCVTFIHFFVPYVPVAFAPSTMIFEAFRFWRPESDIDIFFFPTKTGEAMNMKNSWPAFLFSAKSKQV